MNTNPMNQDEADDRQRQAAEASQRAPDGPRAWRHLEQLLRAKPSLLDLSVELRTGIARMEQILAGGEGARVH
jgi:hypothetical protein